MSRAQRSFWVLTGVTILAAGLVAQALAEPAGPGMDILLAASALLLLASGGLLIRVLAYLSRSRPAPPPRRRPSANGEGADKPPAFACAPMNAGRAVGASAEPRGGKRRHTGMRAVSVLLGGLLLAAAGLLGLATPAGASCALPATPSPYAFTGTVTAVDNDNRVATVQTETGRVVTVIGTPDENSAATSVDRSYVVGARYEFHPLNGQSPYRDNACTATTRIDADSSVPPGTPEAGATPRSEPNLWWPVAIGSATVVAVLIPLLLHRRHALGARS